MIMSEDALFLSISILGLIALALLFSWIVHLFIKDRGDYKDGEK